MTRFPIATAVLMTAGLAGCDGFDVGRAQFFAPIPTPAAIAPAPILLDDLTMAQLRQSDIPLILASDDTGAVLATFTQEVVAGDTEIWASPDGVRMTFRNGVLVGSEEIGSDLLMAEPGRPVTELEGERYVRSYHHDTGARVTVSSFDCAMQRSAEDEIEILDLRLASVRLDETCLGPAGETLNNAYWLAEDGTVIASRQWVNAELGSIDLKRLIQ